MNANSVDQLYNQDLNAQPSLQTFNPGVKPSGAPVTFNQGAQNTMNNMFGTPVAGSFNRVVTSQPAVNVPVSQPQDIPTTQDYNYNQQNY